MTPQEFKAWFDGFTEALDGTPTKDQWARIKKRVSEIDGTPVTEHHWHTTYMPQYVRPAYPPYPIWTTCNLSASDVNRTTGVFYNQSELGKNEFSSLSAMNLLGKVDASACGMLSGS